MGEGPGFGGGGLLLTTLKQCERRPATIPGVSCDERILKMQKILPDASHGQILRNRNKNVTHGVGHFPDAKDSPELPEHNTQTSVHNLSLFQF